MSGPPSSFMEEGCAGSAAPLRGSTEETHEQGGETPCMSLPRHRQETSSPQVVDRNQRLLLDSRKLEDELRARGLLPSPSPAEMGLTGDDSSSATATPAIPPPPQPVEPVRKGHVGRASPPLAWHFPSGEYVLQTVSSLSPSPTPAIPAPAPVSAPPAMLVGQRPSRSPQQAEGGISPSALHQRASLSEVWDASSSSSSQSPSSLVIPAPPTTSPTPPSLSALPSVPPFVVRRRASLPQTFPHTIPIPSTRAPSSPPFDSFSTGSLYEQPSAEVQHPFPHGHHHHDSRTNHGSRHSSAHSVSRRRRRSYIGPTTSSQSPGTYTHQPDEFAFASADTGSATDSSHLSSLIEVLSTGARALPPEIASHPAVQSITRVIDTGVVSSAKDSESSGNDIEVEKKPQTETLLTGPPAAFSLEGLTRSEGKFVDITDYLNQPQSQVAKGLGIPSSTLSKRWKEAARARKWPWRTVCKIDKEIIALLQNIPPSVSARGPEHMPPEIKSRLMELLRDRQKELRPVVIRL